MATFTRLQAVNRMLRAASEPPVQSLTSTPTNESLLAEDILDEVNEKEQMIGLYVNTFIEEFVPIIIAGPTLGFIILPDTTLAATSWYDDGRGEDVRDSRALRIEIRSVGGANQVFDLNTRSFVHDDPITIKYSLLLPFEEIPTAQQFRVMDIAARMYEMVVQGDPNMQQFLALEANHSRALGRAADWRSRRFDAFRTGQNTIPRRANRVPRDWR